MREASTYNVGDLKKKKKIQEKKAKVRDSRRGECELYFHILSDINETERG